MLPLLPRFIHHTPFDSRRMAPTTELELRQFLSSKDIPCYELERLPGTLANHCWRITTLLGRRSIIKNTAPNDDTPEPIPPDTPRLHKEHRALTQLRLLLAEDKHVVIPDVLHYFTEQRVLHISDGGDRNIKEGYHEPDLDIEALGRRLGRWLAAFHKATSSSSELDQSWCRTVARSEYKTTYRSLPMVLGNHGLDAALGQRIMERYTNRGGDDGLCLCHGEFWPQNVIITDTELEVKVEEEDQAHRPVMTVINWESVSVDDGATDAASFAALSWLLDRFHGGRGLYEAFLSAYISERALSEHDKTSFAVHFATHIIFCSHMDWTDEAGTKKILEIGMQILTDVDSGQVEKLRNGVLEPLWN